jgi:4-amino-4-deoxy-L-arabinose transferase-like glycosyltransferase
VLPNGRLREPIPFGKAPGPFRLLGKGLGQQGGWLLPLAAFGLLALASQWGSAALAGRRSPERGDRRLPAERGDRRSGREGGAPEAAPTGRRDPRLAVGLVLGGWFAVEAAVLSLSKGIVHPYYVSALAPGAAAAIGAGAVAFVDFARRRDLRLALLPLAVLGTAGVQALLLDKQHYMHWFVPILLGGAALGACLTAVKRLAAPAMALTLAVLLAAPAAFAATTWLGPVEGTFPAAGPHEATGTGTYGLSVHGEDESRSLIAYVSTHRPGSKWPLLVEASPTAAPFVLMGFHAGAMGGYSGTDPALDGRSLGAMVTRGEARYVMIGGAYSSRGGNRASRAVLGACALVRPALWHGPDPSPHSYVLFDCAGDGRALAREPSA